MGSPRTLYNELVVSDVTATSSAGQVIAGFDRLNSNNPLHDAIAVIEAGIATASVTVTLVESDTTDVAAAMTAVADDEVQGTNPFQITSANDAQTHILGYLGDARYVGITISTGDFRSNVWFVGGNPRDNVR